MLLEAYFGKQFVTGTNSTGLVKQHHLSAARMLL